MRALFSTEILQTVAVKGLKTQAHLAEINFFRVTGVTKRIGVCFFAFFVVVVVDVVAIFSFLLMQWVCFADINECDQQNGGCLQSCINTKGSFVCTCTPGYQLGVDGRSCYREYIACRAFIHCAC